MTERKNIGIGETNMILTSTDDRYPEHICADGHPDWGPSENCPNCPTSRMLSAKGNDERTTCVDSYLRSLRDNRRV